MISRKKPKEWYLNHQRTMWLYLSQQPWLRKVGWIGWNRFNHPYTNHCFACQYTIDYYKFIDCNNCLLEWNTENCEDCDPDNIGYFEQWNSARTRKDKIRLAKMIANLLLKE